MIWNGEENQWRHTGWKEEMNNRILRFFDVFEIFNQTVDRIQVGIKEINGWHIQFLSFHADALQDLWGWDFMIECQQLSPQTTYRHQQHNQSPSIPITPESMISYIRQHEETILEVCESTTKTTNSSFWRVFLIISFKIPIWVIVFNDGWLAAWIQCNQHNSGYSNPPSPHHPIATIIPTTIIPPPSSHRHPITIIHRSSIINSNAMYFVATLLLNSSLFVFVLFVFVLFVFVTFFFCCCCCLA